MERRKIVAIAGDARVEEGSLKYQIAYEVGKALIDNGYRIQTGGLGGVMSAACRGAKSSEKYTDGDIIALVPSFDINEVNEYADIVIPTGLDVMRNALVANASAVVAIGGGAGTLTEIAFAWTFGRLVIAISNVDGWSSKLAGTCVDSRVRYPEIENDMVYPATNGAEVVEILNNNIDKYYRRHKGIVFEDGIRK
ncbi:MAG: acyl-CoA synthetase [Clostridia bacterium]|nr:acyl-CoA synthetase [Clostridia bacterium]